MSLDSKLESILINSVAKKSNQLEKVAEESTSLLLSDSNSRGLVKIASVLRNVRVDPTYEELYNFIGGLHGNR